MILMLNSKKIQSLIAISLVIIISFLGIYYAKTMIKDTNTNKNTNTKQTISKLTVLKDIPKFKTIANVKEKKSQFFEFIYPMVVNANIDILSERKHVQESNSYSDNISKTCKKYRIKCTEDNYKKSFLDKVNVIPASLTLAQAANESSPSICGQTATGFCND